MSITTLSIEYLHPLRINVYYLGTLAEEYIPIVCAGLAVPSHGSALRMYAATGNCGSQCGSFNALPGPDLTLVGFPS